MVLLVSYMKYLPVVGLGIISVVIIGVILLIEGENSKPRVVTDENGNEFTLGVDSSDDSSYSVNVGDKAPDFTLTTYDGKVVKLSDLYKEKPVIMQFWATWCEICEREFPENNTYAQENKDKFHFLAVNWAESASQVESYISRKNLDPTAITFLMNESSDVVRAYGVRGTPTHTIIDTKGQVFFYNVGYTTVSQFSAAINSL